MTHRASVAASTNDQHHAADCDVRHVVQGTSFLAEPDSEFVFDVALSVDGGLTQNGVLAADIQLAKI